MGKTEIDKSSIKLLENIKKASNILLDNKNGKFKSIVIGTLDPKRFELEFRKKLNNYNYINYQLIHFNNIINEDFYSDKLLIIVVKYGTSIEALRYSFRDSLFIDCVYGNLLDCTDFTIDFMTKNLKFGEMNE